MQVRLFKVRIIPYLFLSKNPPAAYTAGGGRMMRICFVTSGSLADYTERQSEGQTDVILCGFQALGEVSYERELKGETGLFADVALLSRERRCTVISGCFTDARGMHRKSVVVADKGRVLGVSDMVNRIDGGAYRAGAGVKIYETSAGKLGIVVAEDLYFSRVIETLSVCGADAAVCIFEQLTEGLEPVLARAQAFLCGIPVILCGYGYSLIADIGGKVRFASAKSPCLYDLEKEQEYHLVETRRRGFFRSGRKGF